jgi:hypothetical protein
MADLSDVEQALVGLIAQVLYPAGIPEGPPPASTAGMPCRIFRGFPTAKSLEGDLHAGIVNVSVWPTDVAKNTTRHPADWRVLAVAPPTLTMNVEGNTVTIGGSASAGHNAALIIDGVGYAVQTQANDTPFTIAAALATLVAADRTATSIGPVVSIPGAIHVQARVGTLATSIREVSRELRQFSIVLWCPDPASRDTVAKIVDPALSAVTRLDLPDGCQGHLQPVNHGRPEDGQQKEELYRRTLTFSVEYGITQTRIDPTVVIISTGIASHTTAATTSVSSFGIRIDSTRPQP